MPRAMMPHDLCLGMYQQGPLRVRHEARPPEFEGPQEACHADALEVCFVTNGEEHARIGSQAQTLGAGQYGLVPPGVVHSSWVGERGDREVIVHLPQSMIDHALDESGLAAAREIPIGPFPISPTAMHLIKALGLELEARAWPGRDLMIESLCHGLCLWVVGEHLRAPSQRRHAGRPTYRGVVAAEELMRSSPEERYSIDDLATVARMGRFRFHRLFKEVFGLAPHAYLLKLRIERAVELIERTDLSLTTIAFDLGFSSSGRFTEAFKRFQGHTPSEHRRRVGRNRKNERTIRAVNACARH
jgi:AraC-like DNA-binding protein